MVVTGLPRPKIAKNIELQILTDLLVSCNVCLNVFCQFFCILLDPAEKPIRSRTLSWEREKFFLQIIFLKLHVKLFLRRKV